MAYLLRAHPEQQPAKYLTEFKSHCHGESYIWQCQKHLHARIIAMLFIKADGRVTAKKDVVPWVIRTWKKGHCRMTLPSNRGQANRYGSLRPYNSESGPVRRSISESKCCWTITDYPLCQSTSKLEDRRLWCNKRTHKSRAPWQIRGRRSWGLSLPSRRQCGSSPWEITVLGPAYHLRYLVPRKYRETYIDGGPKNSCKTRELTSRKRLDGLTR